MQTQIRNYRILLTALGLQTVMASCMPIYGSINLLRLRAWQDDPLSGAAIVALLLGIFLAVGGVILVLRAIKYQGRAGVQLKFQA